MLYNAVMIFFSLALLATLHQTLLRKRTTKQINFMS